MLQFSISRLIKRRRPMFTRRRDRLVLKDIPPTGIMIGNLERLLTRIANSWWSKSRDRLLPAYRTELENAAREPSPLIMDDTGTPGSFASVIASIAEEIDALIVEITPELRDFAISYERTHRARWITSMTPTGVDLATLLDPSDAGSTMETFVEQNVSLVRDISREARTRIEGIVFRGFTARTPAQQIAREISAATGLGRQRALRIASDQTVKLSSELDTVRMEQAGIDSFEWVHSGKVHARPWHKERNGQTFKLRGEIAPDDMPGVPVACGCRKRAVITFDEAA